MAKDPAKATLGIIILVTVLGVAFWRLLAPLDDPGHCDLSAQACPISLSGQPFEVELIPRRPAAGDEMLLVLRPASEAGSLSGIKEMRVEFSMPGMDMGEHIMPLESTENGALEGRIALPFCPMGHSRWLVSIRADAMDAHAPVAELVLHVGE